MKSVHIIIYMVQTLLEIQSFYLLLLNMHNQKFNPYGAFPSRSNQLYEQQYEDQQSDEPLVEEIDDSYEPTDKQVRQYAVQTLGMRLPEDQGLLYLARQGLKAPLPDNWVPYQTRDGEVYYKHRITQQKTYDHPTDLEYRKKYEQQKQKMARKNLKSMNMKASNQLGLGPNSNILSNNASNLFGSKMSNSNMFSGNAISSVNDSQPSIKLDPRIEQQLEEQLENYEERLKKQWKQFEIQERQRSQNKIKKLKQDYENEINKIFSGKHKEVKIQDKLKQEKDKIKERIEENLDSTLKQELREFQKQSQIKNREFHSVYQQDMHLKINKYQQQKDIQFNQKQRKLEELIARLTRQKQNKKKQIQETLKRLKSEFENGQNRQIEAATADALEQELNSIKISYAQKIKDKQVQLQRQFLQTKRVLGFDQNAYLSELASKKSRIKNISQQKIESYKKKEMQSLIMKYQTQLQEAQKDLKQKLSMEYSEKLAQQRYRQEQRISKQKQRLDKEFKQKTEAKIENIYQQMKSKIKIYETEMNKKLASVQQKFINDIHGKSKGQSKDISYRIELKQKQMSLQNKSMLINSLKRQIQLENVTLQLMKLQSDMYHCKDEHQIDEKLIKLAKLHQLQYRSDKFLKFESTFKEMKTQCRKDKEFLASVMGSLQNYKGPNPIGSQAILKQYNQDVRTMRQNEQMLRKMQSLLKKAEINDKEAIEQLSKDNLQYKQIDLKREMIRTGSVPAQIQEIHQQKIASRTQQPFNKTKDIQATLKDHSKFLSNMRSQLNRKLYQLRCGTYY